MGLVLRRADDPSFEVTLGDKLLSLGSDAACDVRLAGPGIAGMHLRISAVAIEALVAVTVGGIRLGAGRSRRCVPSRLRVGEASFTIESVGESSVATRELVLRALAVGADLGPRIVVVEGPSSGRERLLQAGRGCTVGRDPSSDLAVDDPEALLPGIRNAGAVFLGRYTPEVIGDYVGGPNHVLPTARSARFSSGLSVLDFMKRTTLAKMTPESLKAIGPAAERLANSESLQAHGLSVRARLDTLNG